MATIDYSQLLRSFYEAVSSRELDRALSFFSEDAEFHDKSTLRKYRGSSEIKRMIMDWNALLPDMKLDIKNLFFSGDNAVIELIVTGTHRGVLKTPEGDIAPTGRHVTVPACDVIRFKNGKIYSLNCYFEGSVFMQQLGVQTAKVAA